MMDERKLVKTLRFEPEVVRIIRDMKWTEDGKIGILEEKLERKTYLNVNKALEQMGGKWDKKKKGHVFPLDPRHQVEGLLETGTLQVVRDGFFETPKVVIDKMLAFVPPRIHFDKFTRMRVLEPSAGLGKIAEAIHEQCPNILLTLVEKDSARAKHLRDRGWYSVVEGDFLAYDGSCSPGEPGFGPVAHTFHAVYMNPPFELEQDIDHVLHAFDMLEKGGMMVAIMSEGTFFRNTRKSARFRKFLEEHKAKTEALPDGTFKESGTDVKARLVVIAN